MLINLAIKRLVQLIKKFMTSVVREIVVESNRILLNNAEKSKINFKLRNKFEI